MVEEMIDKLRDVDCVDISLCYKSHGTAVWVYLGEGERQYIAGSGDSLREALEAAITSVDVDSVGVATPTQQ